MSSLDILLVLLIGGPAVLCLYAVLCQVVVQAVDNIVRSIRRIRRR